MFSLFKEEDTTDAPLSFYNTASRTLEPFVPLRKGEVTMYSCGPTVYDYAHIGNLRAYIFADILKRTLMYNGYRVRSTMNFTDFGHLTSDADTGDDKMMKGLKREGYDMTLENMRRLGDKYIAAFKADTKALHILPPTQYTRASDYVKEQIALIKTLDEKGYTYETSDGVYFDVSRYPQYGRLGNIDLDALKAGARVAVNEEKKHPADFALWKKSPLGWESDFGTGFPGWHIECSAMAMATLGKQIDIHTGGIDHIAVHHNAEIAQCECATGKQFVRYWLHNNHLKIADEKLAKSAGNAYTLKEIVERGFSPEDFRYLMLQSHYRSPANFSFEALEASKQALTRLKRLVYEELGEQPVAAADSQYEHDFAVAMNTDLDSPKALSILFTLAKDTTVAPAVKLATIQVFDSILNIGLSLSIQEGRTALGTVTEESLPADIAALINKRDVAREDKDWAESDRLRNELTAKGYKVDDTKDGTKVSKV